MSVASKNLFAYLGNDSDGEEKIPVPVKTVDKKTTGTVKRNVAEPQAPAPRAGASNNRRGPGGSEGAFRDRAAGRQSNEGRSTEEQAGGRGPRGGAGARVRGGRGARRQGGDDRVPRHAGQGGSEKQAAASWGAVEGEAELKDEEAADAMAKNEQKDALAEDAAEEVAEPEDKSVSYNDYLAQVAEKKAALDSSLNLRTANEGSKPDKKWQSAQTLENKEEDYFVAKDGKKQRERERKVKQTVDFDPRFVEPERGSRGGPRAGGRGRAEGGGRGGPRGGNFRGGRGGRDNAAAAKIDTKDENAFPSLGGK